MERRDKENGKDRKESEPKLYKYNYQCNDFNECCLALGTSCITVTRYDGFHEFTLDETV